MLLTYTWVVIIQVYPCVNINQAGLFMHFEVDTLGTSLEGQWLRLCLLIQEMRFQSLVRELRSDMLQGQKRKHNHRTQAVL